MAMGAHVLAQPLSYYRFHVSNLHAVDPKDMAKLRRKLELDEVALNVLYPLLLRQGVAAECVAALLDPVWIDVNRTTLRTFGGNRLRTLRTEMRFFRSEFKNPRVGYLLYKYLVVGTATLLLPPRTFYRLRDWYAKRDLGGFRDWAAKQMNSRDFVHDRVFERNTDDKLGGTST
jgi:hypothetical protein